MNHRYVAKVLGMIVAFVATTMVFPLLWSWFAGEAAMRDGFLLSIGLGLALGGALYACGRRSRQEFYRREGLAVVSLGWVAGAAVGSLPFLFCPEFSERHGFTEAYFESMSGFTTTGSTVLTDIEAMPEGLLLWRSFTQWQGGVGIVVLFVAVLPALGVEAKHLYKVEVPGIKKEGGTPRIRDAASLLVKIYLGLTAAETALLMLGGMSLFDALNHTFATLATGGFSTKNASIAHFQSLYLEIVIIAFMFLVGINFSLHSLLLKGRAREFWRDHEFRVYLALTLLAAAALALWLTLAGGKTSGGALREAAFQAVSILTTTGFCTADFDQWPHFCRALLVALMFVGGCAGSTAGSMKVIRWVVAARLSWAEIEKFLMPRVVKQIKVGGQPVPENTLSAVAGFFILFLGTWAAGTLLMAGMCPDLETAASSVIACLGNIGPGLSMAGAVQNFGWVPVPGKWFLSLCMVLGRLELFTFMVLFIPSFWKE